uniref:Ribonuclease H-like domain-containing protein n=1 Tax=Tanacetum cinerariifolium TaxID=118510 RepID=A0A6L2K1A3_TANCI|nr:ribonuclease H-like domain-containing protein [Tanacetum cinerariifolium]
MEELLQAPMKGYGEAIVIPEINVDHFEIKTNLLELVQANPYHGFERENSHTHINNFKRITSTLIFRDVPNDVIKLMMFPYSLERAARVWYDKEPPNSILTWDDLVNKFMNQFFPPSKTTHLKNEISRFTQRFEETFGEAWEQFKEMLRASSRNLLSKTTREALNIIENKSKVRYSRYKPNVSRMNTTSRENASKTDDRIDKLADQISTLVDIFAKKVVTPATVKVVEESYITCGGNHAYYNCDATDNNQSSVCVATGAYNQLAPQNRASNHMAPPDFALVQNSQNSFADALLLMPKFASTIKSLLANKDKLFELAKIPLNENCSAMLLKKLPKKLGDPGKFLIPCDFPRMDVCHALGDLAASINLMPLSIWKKLSLPKLIPTRMTLKLADRSITCPKGVTEDVFVKVEKFHFPTDFVVVDFEIDPWVPLILGRSFLRTGRALIDVYREKITLQVHLLQEFDIIIRDKKGTENLAADHLSRLENPHKDVFENKDIDENFPLETLGKISSGSTLWFVDSTIFMRGILSSKRCRPNKRRNSLRTLDIIFGTIPTFFVFVRIKSFDGMYGQEANDILKACHEGPTGGHYGANFTAKKKLQLNELNELHDQAYENSLIYKEKMKKLHDSKIKNRIFNVGDPVLLFNSRLKIFSRKIKSRWSGPFTITQDFSYGTIELSQPDGLNFKVNGHRVKHYFEEDLPSKDLRARKFLGTGKQIGKLYYFKGNEGIDFESSKFNKGSYKITSRDRDVKVFEDIFPFKQNISSIIDNSVQDVNHLNFFNTDIFDDLLDMPNDVERMIHILKRHDTPPPPHSSSPFPPTFKGDGEHSHGAYASVGEGERSSRPSTFPRNFNDFIVDSKVKYGLEKYHKHWVDAMNAEIDALYKNNTLELADLLAGRKAIGFKWVYKIKYKSDGEIERIKGRLVVKGYNQWEGIDFDEKNLNETVYMSLPFGYFPSDENKVCKLSKSLYGLKQAPKKWNAKLTSALIKNGFTQSKSDYSLFTKNKDNVFIALLVYVDDIIIIGSSLIEIETFKKFLKTKILIKDLGKLKYFLSIEVLETKSGMCLTQSKYAFDLITEFGLLDGESSYIPLPPNNALSSKPTDTDPKLKNVTGYQKLIGKLNYLTTTRSDIAYIVSCLSFGYCFKGNKAS